jgi:hypothetical protein
MAPSFTGPRAVANPSIAAAVLRITYPSVRKNSILDLGLMGHSHRDEELSPGIRRITLENSVSPVRFGGADLLPPHVLIMHEHRKTVAMQFASNPFQIA